MAKRDADGAVKKPYSSKLMQLKFMQRGAKSQAAATAKQEAEQSADGEGWLANRGPEAGCRVIMEGDPQPGGLIGRFSFQSFNSATEKLQREKELEKQEALNPEGKSVSDEDMAAQLAQERRKQQKLDEGSPPQPQNAGKKGKEGGEQRRSKANVGKRYFVGRPG